MPSLDQQSMRKHLLNAPRISQTICLRVIIWSMVLQSVRKPHRPFFNYDFTISRISFQGSWHTPFLQS